jgi:hypothetical protein
VNQPSRKRAVVGNPAEEAGEEEELEQETSLGNQTLAQVRDNDNRRDDSTVNRI